MAKTTEQLLQQAVQIRDEQANKKNTALRVGTLFSDIIEKQEESDQTHTSDVTKINESINENKEKLTELGEKIPNTNFITCSTLNSVANKTVNILDFKLSNRVRLLIKMVNANAADNANLSISSPQLDTKPLYYNGERASATNTWEAGAVLDIYYDGANFQATDFQGGAGSEEVGLIENNIASQLGKDDILYSYDSTNDAKTLNVRLIIPTKQYKVGEIKRVYLYNYNNFQDVYIVSLNAEDLICKKKVLLLWDNSLGCYTPSEQFVVESGEVYGFLKNSTSATYWQVVDAEDADRTASTDINVGDTATLQAAYQNYRLMYGINNYGIIDRVAAVEKSMPKPTVMNEFAVEKLDFGFQADNLFDNYFIRNGYYISTATSTDTEIKTNTDKDDSGDFKNKIAVVPIDGIGFYFLSGFTFFNVYFNLLLLDKDENVIGNVYKKASDYIKNAAWIKYEIANDDVKFLAFDVRNNVSNTIKENTDIDDGICLYKNVCDASLIGKQPANFKILNCSTEVKNLIRYSPTVTYDGSNYIIEEPCNGGYINLLGYRYSLAKFGSTPAKDFIEYNEDGDIIKESKIYDSSSNVPDSGEEYRYIKLDDSTRKFKLIISGQYNSSSGWVKHTLGEVKNKLCVTLTSKPSSAIQVNPILTSVNNSDIPLKIYDLDGVIVFVFGDSISDFGNGTTNMSWVYALAKETGAAIYNYAKGDATLCGWLQEYLSGGKNSDNCVPKQIEQALASGIVPDIVVIEGITNDYSVKNNGAIRAYYGEYNFGEFDFESYPNAEVTTESKHTVAGVIQYALQEFQKLNPYVKVFLSSQFHELVGADYGGRNAFFDTYNTQLRELAGKLRLPIIDFENCGIVEFPDNPETNVHFHDYTHPSGYGIKEMGVRAVADIRANYIKGYSDDSKIVK